MKKLLALLTVASAMIACSSNDFVDQGDSTAQTADNAVKLGVYVNETRSFNTYGSINTIALKASRDGFGVFGYHHQGRGGEPGNVYDNANDGPDFMYNQQVKFYEGEWVYSPLKYWPNETGTAAQSEDKERLSFLAYAPYAEVQDANGDELQTLNYAADDYWMTEEGIAALNEIVVNAETNEYQATGKGGILGITPNYNTTDPKLIFAVPLDPSKQVDLLWGVAGSAVYTPTNETNYSGEWSFSPYKYTDVEGDEVSIPGGFPFLNMTKPLTTDKVEFHFRHALAKVKFNIDAHIDGEDNTKQLDEGTKIYVQQVQLIGNLMNIGILNLNNETAGEPSWYPFLDENFEPVAGSKLDEANVFELNDRLVDADLDNCTGTYTEDKFEIQSLSSKLIHKEGIDHTLTDDGVTNITEPLTQGGFPMMFIPNNYNQDLQVYIKYDVETPDKMLAYTITNGEKGSRIQNEITKTLKDLRLEPGKFYTINIHVGMTSVKVDATVEDWVDMGDTEINLPHNNDASLQ